MPEQNTLIFINVLTGDSYNDCHIKGSRNIPLNTLEEFAKTLDKDTHIVVYCASYICTASAAAWRMLNTMGFGNVWSYEGGMAEWYHAGLPVEGACSKNYLIESVPRPAERDVAVKEITMDELKDLMAKEGLL